MERIKYTCLECDNECQLSFRGDSSDIPTDCPVDPNDDIQANWELNDST